MSDPVQLSKDNGVAVITIDNPPVNAIGRGVPEGIASAIAEIQKDESVNAAVIIGAGRTFIAGVDINTFVEMTSRKGGQLNLLPLLRQIEDCVKPVVAAIHGTALGGGLELAMACHYRVAVPDAKVGQPEVNLGLIPGMGGTQRLPRLAGVDTAVEMCTSGKPIAATEAAALGILDRLVEGDLLAAAKAFAREMAGKPVRGTRDRNDKLGETRENAAIFAAAREKVRRTRHGLPAPLAAIEAIEAATKMPFDQGRQEEARLFEKCLYSEESKALIHVFFAEREAAKIPGLPKGTALQPVNSVVIVGAGTSGADIASAFTDAGIRAVLKDIKAATLRYDELATADMVIEAVPEDMALKKRVFAELDRVCMPGAILASGTSMLDIDEIAEATSGPEAVIGMHFVRLTGATRVVEVVRGGKTSMNVVATCMQLAKKLGKVAVLAGNCRGLIGGRMLAAYVREAEFLAEEGGAGEAVDSTLSNFGMALGPFRVMEIGGLGVGSDARRESDQTQGPMGRHAHSAEEIVEREIYSLVNEGARMLEEGCALRAGDIDTVFVNGYGFPAFRGGPMWYADTEGLKKVYDRVCEFHKKHGPRWEPAPLLRELAETGKKFAEYQRERPQNSV